MVLKCIALDNEALDSSYQNYMICRLLMGICFLCVSKFETFHTLDGITWHGLYGTD